MAVQLPDELIVEILSMLPAKSLLRCRLVCKSWLSFITSTKFKLMHLHNFNQLNPRYLVRRWSDDKQLYSVHLDDEALTIDHGTVVEFPFNITGVKYYFKIVGCCNGVVCLCDDIYTRSSLDIITLWNPSIRRKLTLTARSFKGSVVVLGFGYERMSDDYKVVRLAYADRFPMKRPQVEVYTVKTGIWRAIRFPDEFSCFFIIITWSQVFFNGYVHWIASDPTCGVSRNSIMTFDISTELFGEIQLPEFLANEYSLTMVVSVVGESLAMIYSTSMYLSLSIMELGSTYMVWVMKEYKNPTSWTMIYKMHYPDKDMGIPLQLRNNVMESTDGDMIIHNHNVGYYVYSQGKWSWLQDLYVDKYQESLALLDVGDI